MNIRTILCSYYHWIIIHHHPSSLLLSVTTLMTTHATWHSRRSQLPGDAAKAARTANQTPPKSRSSCWSCRRPPNPNSGPLKHVKHCETNPGCIKSTTTALCLEKIWKKLWDEQKAEFRRASITMSHDGSDRIKYFQCSMQFPNSSETAANMRYQLNPSRATDSSSLLIFIAFLPMPLCQTPSFRMHIQQSSSIFNLYLALAKIWIHWVANHMEQQALDAKAFRAQIVPGWLDAVRHCGTVAMWDLHLAFCKEGASNWGCFQSLITINYLSIAGLELVASTHTTDMPLTHAHPLLCPGGKPARWASEHQAVQGKVDGKECNLHEQRTSMDQWPFSKPPNCWESDTTGLPVSQWTSRRCVNMLFFLSEESKRWANNQWFYGSHLCLASKA